MLNSGHKDAYFFYVCDFGGQMCVSLLFEYACYTFKCMKNTYNSANEFPTMYAFT
jgi:hypothetical protein